MTKGLMTLGGIAPALPLDEYGQPIPARLSRRVGGELLLKLPQEGRGVQELPRLALGGFMALRAEEGIRSFLSRAAANRTKGRSDRATWSSQNESSLSRQKGRVLEALEMDS